MDRLMEVTRGNMALIGSRDRIGGLAGDGKN